MKVIKQRPCIITLEGHVACVQNIQNINKIS